MRRPMVRNVVIVASLAILLALGSVEVEALAPGRQATLNARPMRPEATGLWRLEDDREHGTPADRLEYERREADYRPYRYYPMPDDVFGFGK